VLAADTLIVHDDGSLAGTPQSPAEARAMLRRFVGVRHEVVSGIALWRAGLAEPVTDVDVAGVSVGAVSEGQIEQYLAGGDWRGKAGGYNLFERQAAGWPIVVEGEPSTVVGLPMPVVTRRLHEWGVEPAVRGSR
jgi:septum formation protein